MASVPNGISVSVLYQYEYLPHNTIHAILSVSASVSVNATLVLEKEILKAMYY